MKTNKTNLLDLTYKELKKAFESINQPGFRAKQLCDWFYKKLIFDPSLMLNFSQELRSVIQENFLLYLPTIDNVAKSKTNNSYKFLLKTNHNKPVESILMIDEKRATVCVSCMIGCPLACKFCATGSEIGFVRKLSPAEIVGQVLAVLKYAQTNGITEKISNIVFMGMGEPFLNQTAVEKSIDIFTSPECFAMSPSRIAVSTAGVGPGIARFIDKTGVRLAVSIHFATNKLRSKYMPVNKKFPLDKLIDELKKISLKKRDSILIEYLLLKGVNDSLTDAKQLALLLHPLKVKVNLIPYNPTASMPGQAPSEKTIEIFANYLRNKGIVTTVRQSKGVDVEGGCGQFALKKKERT